MEFFFLSSGFCSTHCSKKMLTYDKVKDFWQTNGPVAAKLFTWIINQLSSREEDEPRATCFTERRSLTLYFIFYLNRDYFLFGSCISFSSSLAASYL